LSQEEVGPEEFLRGLFIISRIKYFKDKICGYRRRSLKIQVDLIRQAQAAGQPVEKGPVELVMAFSAMTMDLLV
jgi:hypothetical protein